MSKHYKVALLPGDGIGPEVTAQAVAVMEAAAERFQFSIQWKEAPVGGTAIDRTGQPLPADTLDACRESDAILLGAIGDPKFDNADVRPEQGLLALRKALGLYANLRPVQIWSELASHSPLKPEILQGTDLLIYRELTGGLYFGDREQTQDNAFDTCRYSRDEITRIAHPAFKAAQQRRKHLTLVDKANVLATSRLWREVVKDIAAQYPDVSVSYMYVDNAAMQLIRNPAFFDVVLTENMFGDILSDEASMLSGSLGLLPSASIGAESALFEPVHGSWPEAAGQDAANPIATVLSGAMLFRHLGEEEAAQAIEEAVHQVIKAKVVTADLSKDAGFRTSVVGEIIARAVAEPDFQPNMANLELTQTTII